jgi:hypothetical protein
MDRKQTAYQETTWSRKVYQRKGFRTEPGDPNSQGGLQGTFQERCIWMEPKPSIPSKYRNQLVGNHGRKIMRTIKY